MKHAHSISQSDLSNSAIKFLHFFQCYLGIANRALFIREMQLFFSLSILLQTKILQLNIDLNFLRDKKEYKNLNNHLFLQKWRLPVVPQPDQWHRWNCEQEGPNFNPKPRRSTREEDKQFAFVERSKNMDRKATPTSFWMDST